jgi:hypothetical protein
VPLVCLACAAGSTSLICLIYGCSALPGLASSLGAPVCPALSLVQVIDQFVPCRSSLCFFFCLIKSGYLSSIQFVRALPVGLVIVFFLIQAASNQYRNIEGNMSILVDLSIVVIF